MEERGADARLSDIATRANVSRQAIYLHFGDRAGAWTVDTAAELFYAITLPAPWRELTGALEWTPDDYRRSVGELLRRALLD